MDKGKAFLEGKKKFSVAIATLASMLITMFVSDTVLQSELLGYVMPVAELLAGGMYILMEGIRDIKKLNIPTVETVDVTPLPVRALVRHEWDTNQWLKEVSEGKYEPEATFNPAAFHEQVISYATEKGMDISAPMAILLCAEELGQRTPCTSLQDAKAYWQYLFDLACDIRDQLEDQWRQCGFKQAGLYTQLAYARKAAQRITRSYGKVIALEGDTWKSLGSPIYGVTLYSVGAFAPDPETS